MSFALKVCMGVICRNKIVFTISTITNNYSVIQQIYWLYIIKTVLRNWKKTYARHMLEHLHVRCSAITIFTQDQLIHCKHK